METPFISVCFGCASEPPLPVFSSQIIPDEVPNISCVFAGVTCFFCFCHELREGAGRSNPSLTVTLTVVQVTARPGRGFAARFEQSEKNVRIATKMGKNIVHRTVLLSGTFCVVKITVKRLLALTVKILGVVVRDRRSHNWQLWCAFFYASPVSTIVAKRCQEAVVWPSSVTHTFRTSST